jgi:hypothetical protein
VRREPVSPLLNADAVFLASFEALDLHHSGTALAEVRGIGRQAPARWATDNRGDDIDIAHAMQSDAGIACSCVWEGGDAGTATMQLRDGPIQMLVITDAAEEI